ncbi:CheY-like chemotaxis protein [Inhella inkyongensis]|uniref:CheY-like chemotaxis protein n=1 Tax=Inhella inkyongensis TaxID=392593 RepID=A0A840S9N6_9BURK|nr:DUF3369 domain-containing protein [Inhella inkyongensis]MBB5205706.1 CheY-like chemotaxis protein [Inhella inkyongensis]
MNTANTTSDDDWLIDDSDCADSAALPPWRVLVVDDEPDVHSATRLALSNVVYKERPVQVLSAYSGKEGLMMLRREADIALVLLDVVMETEDAGLRLARQIREDLGNHLVRVVLRTGQPGQAPEREVVLQYDINDYKNKTELSSQKLFTTVIASLRAYEGLLMIERNRAGLERILEASTDLYHVRSLREFASGVLNQVSAILDVGADGVLCVLNEAEATGTNLPVVVAATGAYAHMAEPQGAELSQQPFWREVQQAFAEKRSRIEPRSAVLFVGTPEQHEFVVLVTPPLPLADLQRQLLETFCDKIGWAFDNLHALDAMRQAQGRFVQVVAQIFDALHRRAPADLPAELGPLLDHLAQQGLGGLDAETLRQRLLAGCA